MITVTASDGKSGDEKIISYTSCKIVGNGSFGVVYAARMMGEKQEDGSESPESDIAIKKVLQDKRFKVRPPLARPRVMSMAVKSNSS